MKRFLVFLLIVSVSPLIGETHDGKGERAEGPIPLFPGRVQKIEMQVMDSKGEKPAFRFFDDSYTHRFLAQKINNKIYEEEKNPTIKATVDPEAEFLSLTFEGIVFERDKNDPDKVWVSIVGKTKRTRFPEAVSLRELQRGEEKTLKGKTEQSNLLGSGTGTTTATFRYDSSKGEIIYLKIDGHLAVTPTFPPSTTEDSIHITGLSAKRGAVSERPLEVLKLVE